mgnify:CR=1 FL=1
MSPSFGRGLAGAGALAGRLDLSWSSVVSSAGVVGLLGAGAWWAAAERPGLKDASFLPWILAESACVHLFGQVAIRRRDDAAFYRHRVRGPDG